ncbi:hypothetical protein [Streptococcus pseudopneumoniae]|nr:hypothetical protein [Streptococcus pseudopneumoniae]
MAKTGQQFDASNAYEMTVAEADEINRQTLAEYGDNWLEEIEQVVPSQEPTPDVIPGLSENPDYLI